METGFRCEWPRGLPAAGAGLVVDTNLFFGDGETVGTHVVSGDPMLTDLACGDVHLLVGSAAIDAGASDGAPSTDFDGDARPVGGGVDIGADEHRL